jgi:hypothetical protein
VQTVNAVALDFEFPADPELANLHLWLPDEVLAKIDAVLEMLPLRTREDFAVSAILYALRCVEHDAAVVELAFDDPRPYA